MDPREDPSYQRLSSSDWFTRCVQDPEYRIAVIRAPKSKPGLEGALLSKTLNTEDTIRASICLYKVADNQVAETLMFWDIGTGLNGLPGAAHGGIVATLLDEACGIFTSTIVGPGASDLVNISDKSRCATIWPANNTATLFLNVSYHKFVRTPSVVAVRTWMKKREGRKLFVSAELTDKDSNVLAKVESLFLVHRQSTI